MYSHPFAVGHACTLRAQTFDHEPFDIALSLDEIGRGASAKIYKGWTHGAPPLVVAFKDFGPALDSVHEQLLVRELRAVRKVRHPLILPFLGTACWGYHQGIVSLYMKNGNLLQYLKHNPHSDKEHLLLQVAEAVNYLHTVAELAHGDLKCANVLISDLGDALLADFGLSTILKETATRTLTAIRSMNTVAFAAPELLLGSSNPSFLGLSFNPSFLGISDPTQNIPSKSRESDVYAYGMLILEAVTGQVPFAGLNSMAVMLRICSGQHPSRPAKNGFVAVSAAWWEVCLSCWTFDPNGRPAMQLVLQRLNKSSLLPNRQICSLEREEVYDVAFMPCGTRIVSCSELAVQILGITTGQYLRIDRYPRHQRSAAAVCPIGNEIASVTRDLGIQRWDALTGAPLGRRMQGHTDDILCFSYSPDGTRIVSGSRDCTIRLWDASSRSAVGIPLEGHTSLVTSVSFSPDGRHIASASYDATICIWDSGSGKLLATLKGHSDWVTSVCYLPIGSFVDSGSDGLYIVSGSYDETIRIWNTTTLRLVRTMSHSDPDYSTSEPVHSLAVSPSGKYIASGSTSGIRIWSSESGAHVGDRLAEYMDAVVSVAFSPDGKSIVSGSLDGTVYIWELFE